MTALRLALLTAAALPLAACATTMEAPVASAPAVTDTALAAIAQTPHDRLFALFAAAD